RNCPLPPFQSVCEMYARSSTVSLPSRAGTPKQSNQVVLLGDVSVGKSALLHRFVYKDFIEHYNTTIGTSFKSMRVTPRDSGALNDVLLEIWDTAGQERFHSIIPMYYRRAQAAVIVYDTTVPSTFDMAKMWMRELKEKSDIDARMIAVVGNKIDLDSGLISHEEGREYAESEGAMFFETSALSGQNVDQLFFKIAQKLATRESIPSPRIELLDNPRNELSKCCDGVI
ncbi:hypothetical protein PFISCL1PPCAC_24242, partial [Pristionchus fissidentatus]